MARLIVCLLLLGAVAVYGKHEKYEGHQLYRVAGSAEEILALQDALDVLSARPASRLTSGKLEALIRLSPEEIPKWLGHFAKLNMPYRKIADNLAEIIRDEDMKISKAKLAAKRSGKSISWDAYYNTDEINAHLDELAEKYPHLVTVINAGLSYEGRQIKYVKISTTRFENLRKPVILIDAAIHGNEWVTTPVALYIIDQLVVDIAENILTEEIDWIILPMANPDGYEYSINEDRLWRKTRSLSHNGSHVCPGVDINRNFNHEWGTRPISSFPCLPIYEGPSVFSEPETRIIRDVALRHLDRIALYISVHSFGNMILYAWGNNGTLPTNGLILHLAGTQMAQAIDKLSIPGTRRYVVGNAANVLYHTSGTSRDWTLTMGIPLTYTLELPGYDYDFVVPPEYIKQIVTETWAGIAAGAHYVLSNL